MGWLEVLIFLVGVEVDRCQTFVAAEILRVVASELGESEGPSRE